jgi:hypothetical protein
MHTIPNLIECGNRNKIQTFTVIEKTAENQMDRLKIFKSKYNAAHKKNTIKSGQKNLSYKLQNLRKI